MPAVAVMQDAKPEMDLEATKIQYCELKANASVEAARMTRPAKSEYAGPNLLVKKDAKGLQMI
jgi:hypothetical protein